MSWAVLIPILLQYGVPFAEKIWILVTSNAAPTSADWAALKALAMQTPVSQMTDALKRAGIDPSSPQGKIFLDLVT